jgi:hypothetical protein
MGFADKLNNWQETLNTRQCQRCQLKGQWMPHAVKEYGSGGYAQDENGMYRLSTLILCPSCTDLWNKDQQVYIEKWKLDHEPKIQCPYCGAIKSKGKKCDNCGAVGDNNAKQVSYKQETINQNFTNPFQIKIIWSPKLSLLFLSLFSILFVTLSASFFFPDPNYSLALVPVTQRVIGGSVFLCLVFVCILGMIMVYKKRNDKKR